MSDKYKPIAQEKLDELRELAYAATPGPWYDYFEPKENMIEAKGAEWVMGLSPDVCPLIEDSIATDGISELSSIECPKKVLISPQDLEYMAAANPKTILALLDEIERWRKISDGDQAMSTKPNDRSDAALRERLEIAGKATKGPWKIFRQCGKECRIGIATKETLDDFDAKELVIVVDYDDDSSGILREADAAHIAASSPDVVREDIEEILRLREENKRLCGELERRDEEISSLEKDLDFVSLEQYILTEKLFNSRICHKDILCEQEDPKNWKFEGQGGCKNCWDEWARHLASDAIEEAELNAE